MRTLIVMVVGNSPTMISTYFLSYHILVCIETFHAWHIFAMIIPFKRCVLWKIILDVLLYTKIALIVILVLLFLSFCGMGIHISDNFDSTIIYLNVSTCIKKKAILCLFTITKITFFTKKMIFNLFGYNYENVSFFSSIIWANSRTKICYYYENLYKFWRYVQYRFLWYYLGHVYANFRGCLFARLSTQTRSRYRWCYANNS